MGVQDVREGRRALSNAQSYDRVFVKGKQTRLGEHLLALVEKTPAVLSAEVEIGWKSRVGKVSYRRANMDLRGRTLLFEVLRGSTRDYAVAVGLEGSELIMESEQVLQLQTPTGGCYLWIRFFNETEPRDWVTHIGRGTMAEVGLNDFDIYGAVGKGGMGKVFLCKHKATGERLALKVIDKETVFSREGHLQHMVDERLLLELGSDHPFVLKLRYAFQTDSNFYLATEFCEGGDLYHLLKRRRKTLSEEAARIITSEVILALESMHKKGCVYRDLKPDNVLLDTEGHIRLADFGLAKLLKSNSHTFERTNSFCGTAQYTPPEMIQKKYYNQNVDVWCLGIFMYEVIEGSTPFYTREREDMYRRIEKERVKFSNRFSPEAKDLLTQLLQKSPRDRLTLDQIKRHKFFEGVNWEKVKKKQYWTKSIYSSKERKEVALEELRVIDTARYKDLTVDEVEEARGFLGLNIGKKKPDTAQTLPGFSFMSPDIIAKKRRDSSVQPKAHPEHRRKSSNASTYEQRTSAARDCNESFSQGHTRVGGSPVSKVKPRAGSYFSQQSSLSQQSPVSNRPKPSPRGSNLSAAMRRPPRLIPGFRRAQNVTSL